jgi:glc operon protein GlcG
MRKITELDYNDVQIINNAIIKEHTGPGIAVAVVDSHGELLAFFRTDGCPPSAIQIAQNKAFTAVRDRQTSASLGENSRNFAFGITDLGDMRYTGLGGGVPIVLDGEYLGAVAVSGMSQEEDAALADTGIRALLQDQ